MSANSKTRIINSALIKCGEEAITSPSDDSRAARYANRQYDIIRDSLLRAYNWNFAIDRATTAPDATAPAFGFAYKHQMPDDCLRVIGVFDEVEPIQNYTSSTVPHKIEGRYILTDEDTLYIFYIKRVTDEAQFDASFNEVFALALAIDLAYFLTAGADRLARLEGQFQQSVRAAKLADAIEGSPEVIVASDWLDARLIGGSMVNFRPGPISYR